MSGRSTCPECGTVLRIRDRSFVGRKVSCPECKTPLRIEDADRDGKFVFQRVATEEVEVVERKTRGVRPKSSPSIPSNVAPPSFLSRAVKSPMTAIILVVVAVFVLIVVVAMNARLRFSTGSSIAVRKVAEPADDVVEKPVPPAIEPVAVSEEPEPVVNPNKPEPVSIPEVPQSVVESNDVIETQVVISAMEPENIEAPMTWSPLVEAKMQQKILLYKQPKVSRRLLLDALQEQLGVPIRYNIDELGAENLEEKVAFEKERTTLGEILNLVADAAGWKIVVEYTGIRLMKKE